MDSEAWNIFLRQVNSHIDITPREWKVTSCFNILWISSAISCISATTAQQSIPKVGFAVAEELMRVSVQCLLVLNTRAKSKSFFKDSEKGALCYPWFFLPGQYVLLGDTLHPHQSHTG